MAVDVNSVPLSLTIMAGQPRRAISAVSSRAGAVSLTLKVLHFDGYKPLVEQAFYEATIV